MRIFATDQASIDTGFAIFEDNQYTESGVIHKDKSIPIEQRIMEMAKSICSKIKELQADFVVIEDVQNERSIATVIQLARLQGAILFYCANKDIACKILRPTEWRSTLGYKQGPKVKREQLKAQSMEYVKNMGLDIKSIDEAEAIAIGVAAYKTYNTK